MFGSRVYISGMLNSLVDAGFTEPGRALLFVKGLRGSLSHPSGMMENHPTCDKQTKGSLIHILSNRNASS
jgi:hypothetical protein